MNLIERVKNLLTKPKEEWQVINGETLSGMPLIVSYLLPLAAASAIASFIGYAFLFHGGIGVKAGLIYAVIAFLQLVIAVYVNALITDALAPSFSSEKNLNKSIQLVVYAATPVYIGSLLNIIPAIGWLGSLAGAIYSIYLLYIGLPIMKKTPEDKAPIYLIVIILVLAVIYWLISYIILRVFWTSLYGPSIYY
ncbi:MAG TPA: Yip1 family protein [Chitinophagaceae bacterium]